MSEGTSAAASNAPRGLRREELLWLCSLALLLAGGLCAGRAEPYEWVTRRSSSSIAPLPGMLAAVVGAIAAFRVGTLARGGWRGRAGWALFLSAAAPMGAGAALSVFNLVSALQGTVGAGGQLPHHLLYLAMIASAPFVLVELGLLTLRLTRRDASGIVHGLGPLAWSLGVVTFSNLGLGLAG